MPLLLLLSTGPALSAKHALLMPLYSCTLQHVPIPVDEAVLCKAGGLLRDTLKHVHSKGYGHNDVKAANIFLDAEGEHIVVSKQASNASCWSMLPRCRLHEKRYPYQPSNACWLSS